MKNEVRPIDANATIEALRANFQQGSWYGCEEPGYQIAEETVSEMPTIGPYPAHIDREAWEKPCGMCGGKTTLYQHTNTTKLFMNTFGEAATLVAECMACPPYADCCMKGISANSAFKINFCPECGRPLTEEAWARLEKRLCRESEKED